MDCYGFLCCTCIFLTMDVNSAWLYREGKITTFRHCQKAELCSSAKSYYFYSLLNTYVCRWANKISLLKKKKKIIYIIKINLKKVLHEPTESLVALEIDNELYKFACNTCACTNIYKNTNPKSYLLWVRLFGNIANGSTLFANDGTHKLGGHEHAQWNVRLQLRAGTQRGWGLAWCTTWGPSSPAAHCRGIGEHRFIWYVAYLQCIAFHHETIQFLNCSKDREEKIECVGGQDIVLNTTFLKCTAPSCFLTFDCSKFVVALVTGKISICY